MQSQIIDTPLGEITLTPVKNKNNLHLSLKQEGIVVLEKEVDANHLLNFLAASTSPITSSFAITAGSQLTVIDTTEAEEAVITVTGNLSSDPLSFGVSTNNVTYTDYSLIDPTFVPGINGTYTIKCLGYSSIRFGLSGGYLSGAAAATISLTSSAATAGKQDKLIALAKSGLQVKTAHDSFFDACGTLDPTKMDYTGVHASASFQVNGNVAGAEYYKLSSNPLVAAAESGVFSKVPFTPCARVLFGFSLSQRVPQEEHYIEVVSCDSNGVPEVTSNPDTSFTITNFRVLSNVAYVTVDPPISGRIKPTDRICVSGMADSRLNLGPVVVNSVWETQSVVIFPLLSWGNGTYPGGALPRLTRISPTGNANNCGSFLFEGTTSANAIAVTKNAGTSPLVSTAQSFGTSFTDAIQASTQPYTEAFTPRYLSSINLRAESIEFVTQVIDGLTLPIFLKRSQSVPNYYSNYVFRIRSRNLPNKSVAVANIVSVTKTGTTTATVVCDAPHGLTIGDWVTAYGVTDTTNYPNLVAATAVSSIVNTTTFTIVWGTATSAVSFGGTVIRVNGSTLPSYAQTPVVRGIARAAGYMMVATNAAPTVLAGDTIRLAGVRNNVAAVAGLDDRYTVAHITPDIWLGNTATSAVVTGISDTSLIPVGALVAGSGVPALTYIVSVQPGVGFTLSAATTTTVADNQFTITGMLVKAPGATLQPTTGGTLSATTGLIGGAIVKETDLRLNFVKTEDYERTPVEIVSGVNTNDIGESVPVSMVNAPAVTISSGTISAVGAASLSAALSTVDIASAAITITTTSAAIPVTNVQSCAFYQSVTVVTGTLPTLDTMIQGTVDGTNWKDVYQFPRLTTTGYQDTPLLDMTKYSSIRYVRTVSGTTPSFTMSASRMVRQTAGIDFRQKLDRAIDLTSLAGQTGALDVNGCGKFELALTLGAATVAPTLDLRGSYDGVSSFSMGTLAGVANQTVVLNAANKLPIWMWATTSVVGSGIAAGYVVTLRARE